ncbi:hypothetical protein Goklo_004313 [Gossypium klotzschianum]|uniref:Uncharacterized protein n=1 Tax=Gossypium klotzschianum TaxID=34286 RepID=A0A7J8VN86_9ROSI|nr:hypothetical protein [Gossypium klotzschianum]
MTIRLCYCCALYPLHTSVSGRP